MLEFLGKAAIEFIEKELIKAAPEIQKLLLQQLTGTAEMLIEYVCGKQESLAVKLDAPQEDSKPE